MSTINETQTQATVISTTPLMIRVDGATVDCPAAALNDVVYDPDVRVTVTVRNPLLPLVLGKES